MTHSSQQALRAFANKHRLRVQACTEVYLQPDDPAVFAVNVRLHDRKYRLLASAENLVLTAKVEVPIFFSVGAAHPMLITTSRVTAAEPPVYASPGFEAKVDDWLRIGSRVERLRRLCLRSGESLHVARNETMLVLRPDRDLERAFDMFGDLLGAFSVDAPTGARGPKCLLPDGFRELEPIARKWALQDDREREDALRRASPVVKARLRLAIGPRLKDIDTYLDSLAEPLSEEAIRLQAVGQLGAELAAEEHT